MHSPTKNIFSVRIIGPALMILMLMTGIVCGCRRSADPRLVTADSIMEEHPDSALMLLEEYELSAGSSSYDQARYGLLLTHARYKNFIDETDDSLISVSSEYFLNHSDKGMASRSLFLKGIIEMNANKLGEAAVSFSEGLDIAKEGGFHMWEGQCATGLSKLYSKLYDGSAQLNYAKQAYEAYSKEDNKDWILYSKLDWARGYNDNCQYNNALQLLDELIEEASIGSDTLVLSESLQLKGLSLFASGRLRESVLNYMEACNLDSSVLNPSDKNNIRIALYEIFGDSLPESLQWLSKKVKAENSLQESFVMLAHKGKYKEAYESLERYKNRQENALSLIFQNNVAESISKYERMRDISRNEKIKNERLTFLILILVFIVISVIAIWVLRERILREKTIRLKTEANLESLRNDFQSQLEKANSISSETLEENKQDSNNDFVRIIRQHYSEANSLCDDFYQYRHSKKYKEEVALKINNIIKDFTDRSSLERIGEYIDDTSGGMYSLFRSDFFDISEENHRLFLFLMLGLSSRTISVIFGQDISAIYNKKSRLNAKIAKSQSIKKNEYLQFF